MAFDPIKRFFDRPLDAAIHAYLGSAVKSLFSEEADDVADPSEALHKGILVGTRVVVLTEVKLS
jgi:hypothetical protein